LLEEALAAARRMGFAEVWLETNSRLTAATSLYKKYGFEPVPSERLLPRCDEAYLLRIAQVRPLPAEASASRQDTASP
jgi:ribosomal protein S18 acetylase RimI-like enzyme